MIQRIQSIYLLLATVLVAVTFAAPLVYFKDVSNDIFLLNGTGFYNGVDQILPTWGIVVIGILSALIPFITIFMYKNRKTQIKCCLFSILLVLFFYITIGVYAYSGLQKFSLIFDSVGYGLAFPLIALILIIMAWVKIRKDEKLVRSLDRIR